MAFSRSRREISSLVGIGAGDVSVAGIWPYKKFEMARCPARGPQAKAANRGAPCSCVTP